MFRWTARRKYIRRIGSSHSSTPFVYVIVYRAPSPSTSCFAFLYVSIPLCFPFSLQESVDRQWLRTTHRLGSSRKTCVQDRLTLLNPFISFVPHTMFSFVLREYNIITAVLRYQSSFVPFPPFQCCPRTQQLCYYQSRSTRTGNPFFVPVEMMQLQPFSRGFLPSEIRWQRIPALSSFFITDVEQWWRTAL